MNGSIIYEFVGSPKRPLDEETLQEFFKFSRKFLNHPEKHDLETLEDIYFTCDELLKRLIDAKNIDNKSDHIETISAIKNDAISKIESLSN